MPYVIGLFILVALLGCYAGCTNGHEYWGRAKDWGCDLYSSSTNMLSKMKPLKYQGEKQARELKAANPARGEAVAENIALAAEVFSIGVGGGGDSLFPSTAFEMSKNMPPAVAKSIEGCYSSPVVPTEGYISQYSVDHGRTNFLCRVIPANGYTGIVFEVRKDKVVRNVGTVPDGAMHVKSWNVK